ncbi:MAG: hypothetical protein ACAH80_04450 [Alphaproteobacteria bacterium]
MSGDPGYTGRRFLLDTQSRRQFIVDFEGGRPGSGIEPVGGTFKAGETVFALDDQTEFSVKDGVATANTTLFQLSVGHDGKPRNLKLMGVSFDVSLRQGPPHFTLEFRLKDDSVKELSRMGFDRHYPRVFTQRADSSSKYFSRTPHGYKVDLRFFDTVAILEQHGLRASSARTGVALLQPPKPLYPDSRLVDNRTLAITKDMEDGRLRTVFNFEMKRVTEIFFDRDGRQAAMNGYAFRDYGEEALQAASERLTALGGMPGEIGDGMAKKFSAKLPPPKP